jgi:hypothetical protein
MQKQSGISLIEVLVSLALLAAAALLCARGHAVTLYADKTSTLNLSTESDDSWLSGAGLQNHCRPEQSAHGRYFLLCQRQAPRQLRVFYVGEKR